MTVPVGIEAIGLAFPRRYLDLEDLARARGVDPAKYTSGLGVKRMSVADAGEDSVALGATAARRLMESANVDPSRIGMLITGTETSVDHSKPVASHIQGLLELPSDMRVFDTKHACYGGTAGVMAAIDWIRSGAARGRSAIVVCSDISRYGLRTAGEPTQGGAAVALLVSSQPRLLAIDHGVSGYGSHPVYDFWRPHGHEEALVDGKYSVNCYLAALADAYGRWRAEALERRLLDAAHGALPSGQLAAFAYHVPFPKMAMKAHAQLRRSDLAHRDRTTLEAIDPNADAPAAQASFEAHVAASLRLPEDLGNCYTASLYLALASQLAAGRGLGGKRIGLFSYGSGCSSEFFSGVVGEEAEAAIASTGIDALLEQRERVGVPEYERIMTTSLDALGDARPRPGAFRLRAIRENRRVYEYQPA